MNKVLAEYLQDNLPDWGLFSLVSALILGIVAISAGFITVMTFYKNPLLLLLEVFLLLWAARTVFGFAGTVMARLGFSYKNVLLNK